MASGNHTVTADDGSFASDTLSNGGVFEFTFNNPGTFAYYCEFHGGPGGEGMSAVITVTN
jgi:plastocyanin